MKPFLTKEDSEKLIVYFKNKAMKDKIFLSQFTMSDIGDPHLNIEAISRVINQCTIKEFPDLFINLLDSTQIKISEYKDGLIFINVVNEYGYFSPDEFKQFAEGINKICQWIDENETIDSHFKEVNE